MEDEANIMLVMQLLLFDDTGLPSEVNRAKQSPVLLAD